MFAATERVRTCLYWLVSDNVNSLTSPLLRLECLLTSAACFCLHKLGEILIELVRKCEELYDMSNKYSDSVWKGKLWGPTGEELKKNQGKFQCFIYCAFWSYRIFSNLIRTSFCRFLKLKKSQFAVLIRTFPSTAPCLQGRLNNTGCYQCFNRYPLHKQCFGRIRRSHSMGGRWWR